MNKYLISVDSSACFSEEDLTKHGFLMARLSYTLDCVDCEDKFESDLQKQELYDKLSTGSTAQSSKVNPHAFIEAWEDAVSQGYDILHLSLSKKVSGSYESALMAARELMDKYNQRIEVVDTKTGSFAATAIALDLKQIQSVATINEAKRFVEENADEYNLIFTIGDIKYLYRGGRIGHIKALVGGLLQLKPILFVNEDGKLAFVMNARGMRKAIDLMMKKMERSITEKTQRAFIAHGGDIALAQRFKEKLINAFPWLEEITVDYLTPVMGIHAGPGALVLCFRGANRDQVLYDDPIKNIIEKVHAVGQKHKNLAKSGTTSSGISE